MLELVLHVDTLRGKTGFRFRLHIVGETLNEITLTLTVPVPYELDIPTEPAFTWKTYSEGIWLTTVENMRVIASTWVTRRCSLSVPGAGGGFASCPWRVMPFRSDFSERRGVVE